MVKRKKVGFHEYRYQLLPVSQNIQLDMDGEIKSLDDLKRNKNEFFKQVFTDIQSFSYSRGPIVHKKVAIEDHTFLLRIGVERDLTRRTKEFEVEDIENWETALIAFNNEPTVQKCLIQQYGGFQYTTTVAKILENSFNRLLAKYQLTIIIEPIYKEAYFWDLVDRHEDKITQIDFELISPNMSNISANLQFDLSALNKSTNTQKTHLQLNSDENSFLTPNRDDELISRLVEYSSQGGGDITLRAKGISKKIHTSKGVNEINIDELFIESRSVEELLRYFKDILQ